MAGQRGVPMRSVIGSRWMKRGLRLSIVVGFAAAALNAWTVWDRYRVAYDRSIKSELTYQCAARLSEQTLKPYMNEMGNINVRKLCLTDDDFYVSPHELQAVRDGTMEFKPYESPFDWPGSAIVGVLWALATILGTVAILGTIALGKWVWGRPQ